MLLLIFEAGAVAEEASVTENGLNVIEPPVLVSDSDAQTFYPKDISGITFSGTAGNTGYAKKNMSTGEATLFASFCVEDTTYTDNNGNYVFVVKKGSVSIPINVICSGNYDVTVNYSITPNAKFDSSKCFYWTAKINGKSMATTDAHGGKNGRSNTEKIAWNIGAFDFNSGENIVTFELFEPDGYARPIVIESIVVTPNSDCSIYCNAACINLTENNEGIEKTVTCNDVANEPWVVSGFYPITKPVSGETYIEFNIDAPIAAEYDISFTKIGLLSGVQTGAKWDVSINGVYLRTVDFSYNYRNKGTETVTANLTKGKNSVRLVYNSTVSQAEDTGKKYGLFLTDISAVPSDKSIINPQKISVDKVPVAGNYFAKVTVKNDSLSQREATLTAVVYDKIKSISFITYKESYTKSVPIGETVEICVPVTVDYGLNDANIKLFIRDDKSIQPIIEPTIIE